MKSCTVLIAIFAAVVLLIGIFLLAYPMGYLYATYENLYGEWMQFAAFLGVAIYSVRIVSQQRTGRSWFWWALGLAALYVALEEISWGQQFFAWNSPVFFQVHNLQGETNLHNFLTGPYSTRLKDGVTWALLAVFFVYGLLYPLMHRVNVNVARRVAALGVPVPSLCLLPYFALFVLCEANLFQFNEAEVAELILALALLYLAASQYYRHRVKNALDDERLGKRFLQLTGLVIITGSGLTFASMYGPNKHGIESRIEAGIKKFADRYERREVWHHAIDLYKKHLALKPSSAARMRQLATAHRRVGQVEQQQALLNQALQLDLARLREDATSAALHRSLFRSFTLLGMPQQASYHIDEALAISLQDLQRYPDSDDAAYSAARTFALLGRGAEALEQFQRAFDLNPRSSRNRRAYRDARGH